MVGQRREVNLASLTFGHELTGGFVADLQQDVGVQMHARGICLALGGHETGFSRAIGLANGGAAVELGDSPLGIGAVPLTDDDDFAHPKFGGSDSAQFGRLGDALDERRESDQAGRFQQLHVGRVLRAFACTARHYSSAEVTCGSIPDRARDDPVVLERDVDTVGAADAGGIQPAAYMSSSAAWSTAVQPSTWPAGYT